MSWKGIILLLIVLGGLSYYALGLNPEEGDIIGKGTGLMSNWTEDELRTINEIHLRKGEQHFEFWKDLQGLWMMRQPEYGLAYMPKVVQILSACRQPEVERVIKMSDEYAKQIKETGIEIELKIVLEKQDIHKSIKLDFFRLPTHKKYDFIRYHKEPHLIYKVNRLIDIDMTLTADNFRDRRLFPFRLEEIKEMEYLSKGKAVKITRVGKRMSFDKQYMSQFVPILRPVPWAQAGCESFVHSPAKGIPYSTYIFKFVSGEQATLHLYLGHDAVAYYVGRDIGMRMSEKTFLKYFPEL